MLLWKNSMRLLIPFVLGAVASAQWLHYPAPGTPRNKDGTANLRAPAPKGGDGRPDLGGVWQIDPTPLEELNRTFGDVTTFDVPGDDAGLYSKYLLSVLADFPRGSSLLLPDALKKAQQNSKLSSRALPTSRCLPAGIPFAETLPFPFKILQTRGLTVIIHEGDGSTRQIYTDGRKHTPDPQPTWNGYSVGRWENGVLIVDTVGFNDLGWLDASGTPHSEALHTTEHYTRKDFGHMEIAVTFEDQKTFSKSFAIRYNAHLLPDTDLQENVCGENERDYQHYR
jgi:hypothetical protein